MRPTLGVDCENRSKEWPGSASAVVIDVEEQCSAKAVQSTRLISNTVFSNRSATGITNEDWPNCTSLGMRNTRKERERSLPSLVNVALEDAGTRGQGALWADQAGANG